MIALRRFLVLADKYTLDHKARVKYGDPIRYNKNVVKKDSLTLYAMYDHGFFIGFFNRMRIVLRRHKESKLFEEDGFNEYTMAAMYGIKSYYAANQKFEDIVSECAARKLVRDFAGADGVRLVEILPAGRKFMKWINFINELCREFGPLLSLGLGGLIVYIITHYQEIFISVKSLLQSFVRGVNLG